MAILSDNPALPTPPPEASPAEAPFSALAEAVDSVGEKLNAALAHTSHAKALASRRQIEHVLGRKLEPQFALELVTLLLVQGGEGRELRAALVKLLSMRESPQWVLASAQDLFQVFSPDDDAKFLASKDAAGMQEFANCAECLAHSAVEHAGESATADEVASLQWARCALCRCGTATWSRR
jgi:hypothetical protein